MHRPAPAASPRSRRAGKAKALAQCRQESSGASSARWRRTSSATRSAAIRTVVWLA